MQGKGTSAPPAAQGPELARVIERVRKLLALATSADLEEARSAAHAAAKLILAHQLEVVPTRELLARREAWRARARAEREEAEAKRRKAEEAAQAQRRAAQPPGDGPADDAAPKPSPIYRFRESHYAGRCASCREPYAVGADILWSPKLHPDTGQRLVTHFECYGVAGFWAGHGIDVATARTSGSWAQ